MLHFLAADEGEGVAYPHFLVPGARKWPFFEGGSQTRPSWAQGRPSGAMHFIHSVREKSSCCANSFPTRPPFCKLPERRLAWTNSVWDFRTMQGTCKVHAVVHVLAKGRHDTTERLCLRRFPSHLHFFGGSFVQARKQKRHFFPCLAKFCSPSITKSTQKKTTKKGLIGVPETFPPLGSSSLEVNIL